MLTEAFVPGDVLSETERSGFVPVGFTDSPGEAEEWKNVLESHDIPVLTEVRRTRGGTMPRLLRSVPVLIPEELLEEASTVVKNMESGRAESKKASGFGGWIVDDSIDEDELDHDTEEEDDLEDDFDEEDDLDDDFDDEDDENDEEDEEDEEDDDFDLDEED